MERHNKDILNISLLEVMDEHERIRNHRDLLMEQIRLKKEVARRQEATIQRLAADRARLRKKVEELEELCKSYRAMPVESAFIELPRYDGCRHVVNIGDKVTWRGMAVEVKEVAWAFSMGWRAKVVAPDLSMCWVPTIMLSPGWKDDAGEIIQRRCIPASAS